MSDDFDSIQFGEAESFVQNSIEVRHARGEFSVEIDNPWAGSTETGFGYTTSLTLTDEQARQIAEFILRKLAEKSTETTA